MKINYENKIEDIRNSLVIHNFESTMVVIRVDHVFLLILQKKN